MDAPLVWIDQAGDIQDCNQAFSFLVKTSLEKIQNKPLEKVFALEKNGRVLSGQNYPAMEVFNNKGQIKGVYTEPQKEASWEITASYQKYSPQGGLAIVAFKNLTNQREENLLGQALTAAENAIAITDPQAKVTWVNQAFSRLTGYGPSEIKGENLALLDSGQTPPEVFQDMWRLISQGQSWSGEMINRKKSGELYTEKQTITPISDSQGKITNFIAFKEDITKVIQKNKRLIRYNFLLQTLFEAHQQYIEKKNPKIIFEGLLQALLELTNSEYGFIGEIKQDARGNPFLKTMAITNIAWNQETRDFYDKSAPSGLEFYNLNTLFGAAITSGRPVISNDPDSDPRAGGRPPGHPPLNSFLGAPLIGGSGMVGLVGVANRPQGYDQDLLKWLGPLLATCSSMIEAMLNEKIRLSTEDKLKNSEERLKAILNAAADGIITINPKGIIESVNKAAEKIFGYQGEEMKGMRVSMLMPPPHDVLHNEYIDRYLKTKKPKVIGIGREVKGRRKNGSLFPLELSVSEANLKQGPMFTGILRDISARKNSEREIRKLSLVARHTDNAVIITDIKGRIQWVNEAFERITEYPLEEVQGKKPGAFLQGPETDPETVKRMSQALQKGEGFDEEIVNYSKSGRKYWLSLEIRAIRDSEGNLANFMAIESDITRRKEAEMALVKARQQEVEVGARIQKTLLLGRPPIEYESIEFAAQTIASQKIDGDFYDFYSHGSSACDLLIGDVMGKGIPAALLGAATKSLFPLAQNQLAGMGLNNFPCPGEIVSMVHSLAVRELIELESFVTLVYARFNLDKMQLDFVDCGHTRTIHLNPEKKINQRLEGVNMPLGFSLEDNFQESSVLIKPGDILVFYSDGVTEAESPEGRMWGERGLIDCITRHAGFSAASLIQIIQKEVLDFSQKDQFADDLTLVVAKLGWPEGEKPLFSIEKEFTAEFKQLPSMRAYLSAHVIKVDSFSHPDWKNQLILAVNEAATNIIKHAYAERPGQRFRLKLCTFEDRVEIRLFHKGKQFFRPPPLLSPPAKGEENGYGLYIIDQTVDVHRYLQNKNQEKYTLLIKKIPLDRLSGFKPLKQINSLSPPDT